MTLRQTHLGTPSPSSTPLGRHTPIAGSLGDGKGRNLLSAEFVHVSRGLARSGGSELHRLGIHFGPTIIADCTVGGVRAHGLQKAGDIGFIPAGADGSWEDDGDCKLLRIGLHASLFGQVAEQLGRDVSRIEFLPRPHMQDARIAALGGAIKAHLEADVPSDPLYLEFLADALAVRLIETSTVLSAAADRVAHDGMSARELKRVTDYIEANLDRKLSLFELAEIAGVSMTRLKTAFRHGIGMPVHQYVMHRRVEYARILLATTSIPMSQIALTAGFSHQSHMATMMRRLLGQTPGQIDRAKTGPSVPAISDLIMSERQQRAP